ncbi:hypothetical protein WME76_02220 [Sorangium sp. So ce119]|uniref:hypothetical protein n=1 Tax=Sorangium sp. So ce119 TaxID=3133279 RepID=UPI003F617325
MTPDEVRIAAGLIPFDDYARAASAAMAQRFPGVKPWRGTGRTTRMLCEALAAASEGRRVHVVAGRRGGWRLPHLQRQALGLARQAGLTLERVCFLAYDEAHKLMHAPREDLVLHEHD